MKHKHHIIPKHAGGTDEPSNIMEVSVEEHAELHLALYLEHGKVADWVAYHMLSGKTTEAEIMRSKLLTERNLQRGSHSEETKRRISESRKGKPPWNKGKKASETHRENLSNAKKGKQSPAQAEVLRKARENVGRDEDGKFCQKDK